MESLARGYIASGEFHGHRAPQHIQNQVVKHYCDANNLTFVLSRAEYWFNENSQCQLWAALTEGYKNIVFFSLWQIPSSKEERNKVYQYCIINKIVLHFAVERISIIPSAEAFDDLEILIESNIITNEINSGNYLEILKELL